MKKTLILGLFLSIGLGACGREDIDDNQINVVADPETVVAPQHLPQIHQPQQQKRQP